jgi:excisionase family DNA binding protein
MKNSVIIEDVTLDSLLISIREILRDEIMKTLPKEIKYLSRAEVRERLGICYPTLDKALKKGTIKGYRISGRILFREDELNLPAFFVSHREQKK